MKAYLKKKNNILCAHSQQLGQYQKREKQYIAILFHHTTVEVYSLFRLFADLVFYMLA